MHKNFWQTAAEKAVLAHCSCIELALVALRVGQWLNRGYSIETAVVRMMKPYELEAQASRKQKSVVAPVI